MRFITDKTGIMTLTNRYVQESLYVRSGYKLIPTIDSGFLGIELDARLSWQEHISKLNSKLSNGAVIHGLKSMVSLKCIRIYYFAHIQS